MISLGSFRFWEYTNKTNPHIKEYENNIYILQICENLEENGDFYKGKGLIMTLDSNFTGLNNSIHSTNQYLTDNADCLKFNKIIKSIYLLKRISSIVHLK